MALLKNVNELPYAFFFVRLATQMDDKKMLQWKKNIIYRNVVNTFVSLNLMKF